MQGLRTKRVCRQSEGEANSATFCKRSGSPVITYVFCKDNVIVMTRRWGDVDLYAVAVGDESWVVIVSISATPTLVPTLKFTDF